MDKIEKLNLAVIEAQRFINKANMFIEAEASKKERWHIKI